MSVRPSVRPYEKLGSHRTDFHKISCLSIFQKKTVTEIPVPLKSNNNTGTLHADRYTFLIISRSVPRIMRNASDKSCTENQNTHFVTNTDFSKIVPFMR